MTRSLSPERYFLVTPVARIFLSPAACIALPLR
jgi:hypothetical protein